MANELASCPFCGEQPREGFHGDDDGGYYCIECHACRRPKLLEAERFIGVHAESAQDAAEAWNNRPDHAATIAALEAKLADALQWKDLLDAKKALGARVVAEAVAAENEACAELCDGLAQMAEEARSTDAEAGCDSCAIAIRSRSRTPKETGADLSGAERKTS